MPQNYNWEPWDNERRAFLARDTEGITKDLKALKAHILALQRICPKDSAGWPVGTALTVIISLQDNYTRFSQYLDQVAQ